ncbi:MAG: heavy metal translocating P-type ATPase [Pseudomonadota bacterium]
MAGTAADTTIALDRPKRRQWRGDPDRPDVTAYVIDLADGRRTLHLMIEGIHCGGCVAKIERAAKALPGMVDARVNMTTRRLTATWDGAPSLGNELVAALGEIGFGAVPYDPERLQQSDSQDERSLLRALAVAGFAAANVMLLSVAIWAGHAQGMAEATRTLLHWFSALIALPALVYAGRPFYHSAWSALRHGRTNMDVPITLGVVLAAAISLHETIVGGPHAYFDSAITLLFFLLIGRYLDRRARRLARAAAERLLALGAQSVTVLMGGETRTVPAEQVAPGMTVLVAAGERIGIDGTVENGLSELDTSLITGETLPRPVKAGDRVFAGTVNLGAPLRLTADAVGDDTLLSEIVRLMEAAEQGKARFVGIADRISRLYAPVVHLLALGTFLGWWLIIGLAWQPALLIAISVLIVTCPCALGLAVPVVQVIATSRLMKRGILVKSNSALERAANIDTVVFDKTGTLTLGRPSLIDADTADPTALADAASLAQSSRHPLARALVREAPTAEPVDGVEEVPGQGLRRETTDGEIRMGSRRFCGVAEDDRDPGMELWLSRPGQAPVRFAFEDQVRSDAADVIATLKAQGIAVELISGDRTAAVEPVAREAGIDQWQAAATPADKVARLNALTEAGRRVMMVGDGLNDAPALAAATVSLSPTSASDIAQTAADFVFQGEALAPVLTVRQTADRSARLVTQNFALAFGYNLITVPIAVAGFVTPLIAAIAMSLSSIVVVMNALRLSRR